MNVASLSPELLLNLLFSDIWKRGINFVAQKILQLFLSWKPKSDFSSNQWKWREFALALVIPFIAQKHMYINWKSHTKVIGVGKKLASYTVVAHLQEQKTEERTKATLITKEEIRSCRWWQLEPNWAIPSSSIILWGLKESPLELLLKCWAEIDFGTLSVLADTETKLYFLVGRVENGIRVYIGDL